MDRQLIGARSDAFDTRPTDSISRPWSSDPDALRTPLVPSTVEVTELTSDASRKGDGAVSSRQRLESPHRGLRPPRRAIVRDVGIVIATVALGLALFPNADAPNPDYTEAVALFAGLEDVHAVTLDGTSVEEATAANPEARLHIVERDSEPTYLLTHEAPVDRFCYALRWRSGDLQPQTGKFAAERSCEPSPSGSFVTEMGGLPLGAERFFPSETETRWWFVPALLVLVALGLAAVVRIGLVFLRGDAGHSYHAAPKH